MNTIAQLARSAATDLSRIHPAGLALLRAVATAWLTLALLGQLLFAGYLLGLYGHAAAAGCFADWNTVMLNGYAAGETFFNAVSALHLAVTVITIAGGMLRLIPAVRSAVPAFHRWSGRLYLIAAATISICGLAMVWSLGTVGGFWQHVGISLNGVLILAFAAIASQHASARRIDIHRRRRLRSFLAVSGVWFFRVALMAWVAINQGPAGVDPNTLRGPFLIFLSFAQTLLPLAVRELHLRAVDRGLLRMRIAVAALLGVLFLLLALGIFGCACDVVAAFVTGFSVRSPGQRFKSRRQRRHAHRAVT